tara:strand:- start:1391 stop:1855 length:465 start_codon:yes stop_codon:yes gene_type:complete
MLKNINPNLNAELLFVLDSMGHGDELVITDCNFPSYSTAAKTVSGKLVVMAGLDIPILAKAIFSVFPLDSFVQIPVHCMEVVGNSNEKAECHNDMRNILDETSDRHWEMGFIERHGFYKRACNAYAVVCAAAERRPYGCFILTKGIIGPNGEVI